MTTSGNERAVAGRPKVMLVQTQAENAGAQEIARLLGLGLEARGYEVHQLFFYRRTDGFDDTPNTHFCCCHRPGTPLAFGKFLVTLWREIRKVKPDVVMTFQHYGNFFGVPAAHLAGVPHVIANQNSAPEMMNRLLRAADRLMGSIGLYHANVVNSTDTEREFAGHPAAYRRRLVHVDHGFQNKAASLTKTEARSLFGLPQDVPLAGTVARLNPMKNLEVPIRALGLMPGVHLALAGQGPDRDRLEAIVAETSVGDRVHFVGELPSVKVGEFLAALDVFAFPSLAETFGLAGARRRRPACRSSPTACPC
ncbi:glycosyltransferase [Methylobrevis pamukkalensis]|uniref:D-inositol 3-phosphate glycosyltransferase n=1 Tax=Methylobrevis pamukkalensis TaxID=1439726 RepID=A0A1E3H6G9_9HYPH|nr:glycosyltransferase [Methylobrevis pamukkalensis]ODN71386.1 D-inositol 3-phosphate glycosyltransferase [Methylobrevis pamukkalensis]